jgi:hypothetical protein
MPDKRCEFEGKLQGRCEREAKCLLVTASGVERHLCLEHGSECEKVLGRFVTVTEYDNGIRA